MLSKLEKCAGEWTGTNELYLSQDAPPDVSQSSLTVTPMLNDTFIRIDQGWSYDGKAQLGSLLIGFDPKSKVATVHLIDTFHVGRKVIAFTGTIGGDGAVEVHGSYPAPPGPDWGWDILIEPAGDRIGIVMFNIHPDGKKELAVKSNFVRRI